jgi:hypothetical protein
MWLAWHYLSGGFEGCYKIKLSGWKLVEFQGAGLAGPVGWFAPEDKYDAIARATYTSTSAVQPVMPGCYMMCLPNILLVCLFVCVPGGREQMQQHQGTTHACSLPAAKPWTGNHAGPELWMHCYWYHHVL